MTTPVNILAPAFCTSCKVFKSSLKCRQLVKLVKETSVHHYHLFIQEEAWIQLYPQATNMLLWGSATQSRTAFPKSQLLANTLAQASPSVKCVPEETLGFRSSKLWLDCSKWKCHLGFSFQKLLETSRTLPELLNNMYTWDTKWSQWLQIVFCHNDCLSHMTDWHCLGNNCKTNSILRMSVLKTG